MKDLFRFILFARFKEEDAFVGYQKDTAAAVVFQASNQLQQYLSGTCTSYLWEVASDKGLLNMPPRDELMFAGEDSELWRKAVSCECSSWRCTARCGVGRHV